MFGITEEVARANGYTGDMRNLPLSTAKAIYKKKYWDANQVDKYPDHLKYALFDAFVNMGYNAIGVLSVAAGLSWKNQYTKTTDGTNNSNINYWDDAGIQKIAKGVSLDQFIAARKQFYMDLVKRKPEQATFINGWLNRLDEVRSNTLSIVKDIVVKNPVASAIAIAVPLGTIFFLIMYFRHKNKKKGRS
jgi:lysozyme family protein